MMIALLASSSRSWWLSLLAIMAAAFAGPLGAADELERRLIEHAPQVLETMQAKGYRNVGVLKFRVKKGTEPATDRAGTLNLRLSEQLELALILANKVRDPVGIVRDANRVAASIPGANHLTPQGRPKLFEKSYPLAWGDEDVVPDAFVTGAALIAADLQSMTVGLMYFDRDDASLTQLAKFDVRMDLDELLESGESFTVRGVFDQASLQMTDEQRRDKASKEAVLTSLDVKSETASQKQPAASKRHPLAAGSGAPVALDILYDGKPQRIEFREGAAFIPEPAEGQTVTLSVRRTGSAKPRLGVVVKVNGENSLYRQRLPDDRCSIWVFEPTLTEFKVPGYQLDDKQLQLFKVLSAGESKAKELDYGEFVGTISISVFPEQSAPPKPSVDLLTDEGEDFEMLTRGVMPKERPKNLSALKHQLTQSVATRGLIAEGVTVARGVEKVKFERDPIPIMTATVKYYSPQDLPE